MDWEAQLEKKLTEVARLLVEPREDLDAWMGYLDRERETRIRTREAYANSLLVFARWWDRPLSELTKDDAIAYKTSRF